MFTVESWALPIKQLLATGRGDPVHSSNSGSAIAPLAPLTPKGRACTRYEMGTDVAGIEAIICLQHTEVPRKNVRSRLPELWVLLARGRHWPAYYARVGPGPVLDCRSRKGRSDSEQTTTARQCSGCKHVLSPVAEHGWQMVRFSTCNLRVFGQTSTTTAATWYRGKH